jgi:hypothetical protein
MTDPGVHDQTIWVFTITGMRILPPARSERDIFLIMPGKI